MPTTTTNMGLQNPVGGDIARDVDKVYIANNNNKIDVHRHTGGADGLQIGLTAIPTGSTIPAPIISGHQHVSGTAPSIAAGAGIGTGGAPAVSIAGHDGAGNIGITTGHASVGTRLADVTFAGAYVTPNIMLTGINGGTPVACCVGNVTINGFSVQVAAAAIDTTYGFYYQVVDQG